MVISNSPHPVSVTSNGGFSIAGYHHISHYLSVKCVFVWVRPPPKSRQRHTYSSTNWHRCRVVWIEPSSTSMIYLRRLLLWPKRSIDDYDRMGRLPVSCSDLLVELCFQTLYLTVIISHRDRIAELDGYDFNTERSKYWDPLERRLEVKIGDLLNQHQTQTNVPWHACC